MDFPLANETPEGIVVKLLPFDPSLLSPPETAVFELVKAWFFVDMTLPEIEDIRTQLDIPKRTTAKGRVLSLMVKANIKHWYQIPFLKTSDVDSIMVPYIDVPHEQHINPHQIKTWELKGKVQLTGKEKNIVNFTKARFFTDFTTPSWREVAAHCGFNSIDSAKNYITYIGKKVGISRQYQLPFVRTN